MSKSPINIAEAKVPEGTQKATKGQKLPVANKGFFRGRVHSITSSELKHPLKRCAPTKEDCDRLIKTLTDRGIKLPRSLQTDVEHRFPKETG